MTYRVNAGFLAPEHWLHDPVLGGGRVLGEACHFVDWMRCLVGAPIRSVFASSTPNRGVYRDDNVSVVLTFDDGSVGTLVYCANGSAELSKEYAEVFCQGSAAILDDYRVVTTFRGDHRERHKFARQDKGHQKEMARLVDAVREGSAMPIPFTELVEVTHATLAILESVAEGVPVDLAHSTPEAG
jgi:predicted dehydrogenase